MASLKAMTDSSKSERVAILRTLSVRVPGSTSNLGPGFDTLGLAVQIYNRVRFDLLERDDPKVPLITFADPAVSQASSLTGGGRQAAGQRHAINLPLDATNYIYRILSQYLAAPEILSRVRISIDCGIPIGSGLGSSGTATLAALWAARELAQLSADRDFLLEEATRIEGHPDNVSPSLLGGFTIAAVASQRGRVVVEKMPWPADWQTLFVVPARELATSRARAVLPRVVAHADAVHNVQRVSLLLGAIAAQDEELLAVAMDDRLHEPYRQELAGELVALRRLLRGSPPAACCLSGAGPSVMIVTNRKNIDTVFETVQHWASKQVQSPRVLKLAVDYEGLKPVYDQ